MAGFFRRVWVFFGIAGITLTIESFRVCEEMGTWLLIAGIMCIIVTIPFTLKDIKESKQQALKREIQYKTQVVFKNSWNEERELERLEQMNIWSMVISWFRKNNNQH